MSSTSDSQPRAAPSIVARVLALPLGVVDVKVCAVDETWLGLKLLIRRSERE
jgi:hypothetical protein